ncbi:uncharacterized protein LOC144148624 [Haemaphysalis longicornis]
MITIPTMPTMPARQNLSVIPTTTTTRTPKTTPTPKRPLTTTTKRSTTTTTTTKRSTTTTTTTKRSSTTTTTTKRSSTTTTTTKRSSTTTTTTKRSTTTTTNTTTTTKAPIIRELLCSVNQVAVLPWVYPPDGMCTYIYYSNLIVTINDQQKYELHEAVGDVSWTMFKTEMKKRTRTEGGAAFDARYITVEGIKGIRNVLVGLAQENIPHYGVLNVLAEANDLKPLLDNTTEVMKELKNLQGGDVKRRTVIAIGLYNYSGAVAWATYRTYFKYAVEQSKADTVIAISSTGFRQSRTTCRAVPPTATTSPDDSFPSLQRHGDLVKPSYRYNNPGAVVGLSMEMATLTYRLDQPTYSLDKIAYAKCTTSGFTSAEIICPSDNTMWKVINSSYQVGFIARDYFVFLADTVSTMAEKVAFVKSLPPRKNFSLLLFNVHMVDTTKRCIPEFFDRIARVKQDLFLN